MRRDYADCPTEQIAHRLARTARQVYSKAKNLGLRKSAGYLSSAAACRLTGDDARGREQRFKPGHATWNKGLRGVTGKHPNTVKHHFRPKNRPHTWVPVGSFRMHDGLVERKVSDTGYPPRDWVGVHRLVWTAAHGPVPPGHVVVFRPGRHSVDPERITIDSLECIDRRELMRRNSVHRHGHEIYRAAQLRGAITRQINRRLRAEQQQHEQGSKGT